MSNTQASVNRQGEVATIRFADTTLHVVGNQARWTEPEAQLIEVTNLTDTERHYVNADTGEEITEPYRNNTIYNIDPNADPQAVAQQVITRISLKPSDLGG